MSVRRVMVFEDYHEGILDRNDGTHALLPREEYEAMVRVVEAGNLYKDAADKANEYIDEANECIDEEADHPFRGDDVFGVMMEGFQLAHKQLFDALDALREVQDEQF